jgi:protein-S-isoprenylcysteine O-methyltransferase Ste14
MNRSISILVACLYLPLFATLLAWAVNGKRPRQFAGGLLSTLWVAATLALLARINLWARWWRFDSIVPIATFVEVPLALYLGWIILWGTLPVILFPHTRLRWVALSFLCIDLCCMPMLAPVVLLSKSWLIGEAVALAFVLLPALCLSRWTMESRLLSIRATLQIVLAGLLFLFLLPEIIFKLRPEAGWSPLLLAPSWLRQLSLQALFLLAVPGISAVFEFTERGDGTPIPYDPPQRLVVSGIYRYIANPMQLSCSLVLLGWALLLRNGWVAVASLVAVFYSAGIAEWDEKQDLVSRFGEEWTVYRKNVKNWLPRWRPYIASNRSRLYIASSCAPCSELRNWISAREPIGLDIIAAESLPVGSIHRMRYDPNDGSEAVEGIRALGRSLEHLHLGWACCGCLLRLPGVWNAVQLLMDVAGFGPRTLQAAKAVDQCAIKGD